MSITLSQELENQIQEKVTSGQYESANEVIQEAIYLLNEHERFKSERLQELREEIQKGFDSGESTILDMENVIRRGKERIALKQNSQE